MKAHLLEEGMGEAAIKIATGEQRQLKNVDLLSRETKVDAVITMEALREGGKGMFAWIESKQVTGKTIEDQIATMIFQ